nr:FAD-binding and (Fe-S)-binding domain-containing protein [Agrobacterium vitis]
MKRFSNHLRAHKFIGEVETDSALRAAMATDNSVYQITPDVIVSPRHAEDLVALLQVAELPEFAELAVTARGGGTGTNGQSLNRGVIVDLRRHMNRLLRLDEVEGWADVEPGMVLDDLNEQIRHSGWFFAPETSTSSRCTIGGMVSTDASGKGSRIYGKTSDNVLGLQLATPHGVLDSMLDPPIWAKDMLAEAELAARKGREAFVAATPRLNRRFTGYDLERACPKIGGFEWWRLLLGAEGTLGLLCGIRVKLRRIEREKHLIVAGFSGFRAAVAAATPLLAADPTAIEVMDETVQSLAENAGLLRRLPPALRPAEGQRVAYVFIELNGDDPAFLHQKAEQCVHILKNLQGCGAIHATSVLPEIRELWAIRSAGVGLLGKVKDKARPVAFVEDAVVPPEHLPAFLDEFLMVLSQNGLGFGIYGHVDVGCLHIRPALNIDSVEDRSRLVAVSDAVFALTRRYGGIFWGEHGKGVRGAYLRDFIGPEAYAALQSVKRAFDPRDRFNPGKLVSNGADIFQIATTPFRAFNAAEDDPLLNAFRCNGNAQCLSYASTTPMCPSFKASADVRQSPKGRADALRAWHHARRDSGADLSRREAELAGTLDTCLGCKACATSCPIQVDIPTMRSAFLSDYYTRHTRPLSEHLLLWAERFSPGLLAVARLVSPVWPLAAYIGEKLMKCEDLPRHLAHVPRVLWLTKKELERPLAASTVIVVQDWFTALFDDDVQQGVVAGLRALGYEPRLLPMLPAGKTALSSGDLTGFRRLAGRLAAQLSRAAETGAPLIAFEPAFALMLRQDYVREGLQLPPVLLPQEFLAKEAQHRRFPQAANAGTARLLSHCTESTAVPEAGALWAKVFAALGVEVTSPQTGCCGMAGLFGHQKRHRAMSRKLFDMSWRRHAEEKDELVATGFSCRCQTKRLSGRRIDHPLALIAQVLGR